MKAGSLPPASLSIPIAVELPAPAHGLAWAGDLARELSSAMTTLLRELRIPGVPRVGLVRSRTSGAIAVRVRDQNFALHPELEGWIHLELERGDREPSAQRLAELCRAIVAASAGALIGNAELTAWLGSYRSGGPRRRLVQAVAAGLADVGIAVPPVEALLTSLDGAASAGLSDVEIIEQLFAKFRPGRLEVRTARNVLGPNDASWLGPALSDTIWRESGVRLPAVEFVEDGGLQPHSAVLKINDVTGHTLFPATGENTVWPAVAREVRRLVYRLVGSLDVEYAIAEVRRTSPELVGIVLNRYRPEAITRVLREIVKEHSILDLPSILERLANFDVVLVDAPEMTVLGDRLPVIGSDRQKALSDWHNQVLFASPI